MFKLFGIIVPEVKEYLVEYLPVENLSNGELLGTGVLLILLTVFGFLFYKSRRQENSEPKPSPRNYGTFKKNPEGDKAQKTTENESEDEYPQGSSTEKPTAKKTGISEKSESIDNEESVGESSVEEDPENYNPDEKAGIEKDKKKRPTNSGSVEEIVDKPPVKGAIKYIGYSPAKKFEQQEEWEYSVVKMPKEGSVIRQPTFGKQKLRGYKEDVFQRRLETSFGKYFSISGDALISTGNNVRPYEPDIFMSCLANNRNIFIDIEIDEPYAGINRHGTHLKGEDDMRDYYFTDRGWIVMRFTEKQVHKEPKNCAGIIAKVIKEIAPDLPVPDELVDEDLPSVVKQWDLLQAQKWEKENYREKYLGHEFKKKLIRNGSDTAVKLTDQDIKVEKEVMSSIAIVDGQEATLGEINERNRFPQDDRINFDPEEHHYEVDGIPYKAVSSLYGRFFPAFDKESVAKKVAKKRGKTKREIIQKWDKAMEDGTDLHLQIEKYLNNEPHDEPIEFNYFLSFLDDHSDLTTFRTEWRVFDSKRKLAGTLDYVTKNANGSYSIYDWKRSKNVVDNYRGFGPNDSHPFGTGVGALSHIDSTSYNKYCLQQGIYKRIVEENYGIEISEMNLVVIHPRYSDYFKFSVPHWEDEVSYVMNSI